MIFISLLFIPLAVFLAVLYRDYGCKTGKYATESDKAIVAKVLKAFETPKIKRIDYVTHPTDCIDYYGNVDVRFNKQNKDYLIENLLTKQGHHYFSLVFRPIAKKWEEDWRAAVKDQRVKEVLG